MCSHHRLAVSQHSHVEAARREATGLAHLWCYQDFGHLEATMWGQLGARVKIMPGRPKMCSHLWWEHDFGHLEATMWGQLGARMKIMPGGPKMCSHHRLAVSQHSHVEAARREATGLAHLWWEHDFGHLEATMWGQLGARMKIMPGGPKMCSHHRLAVSQHS